MRARSADVVVPRTSPRDEPGEVELREKEMVLRRREREIAVRERELERERAYLMGGGQSSQSRVEFPSGGGGGGHLAPPPSLQAGHAQGPPSPRQRQISLSQPTYPSHTSTTAPHAASCGCSQCSVSKYKEHNAGSSSYDLRPPDKPINLRPPPEKPKSWMRRLSMPVGVSMGSLGLGGEGRKKEGAGMGTGMGVLEDGRTVGGRSWEANGTGNRSVTNLRR
jgi:hypothetical protein